MRDEEREQWLARIAYLRPTSLEAVFMVGAEKPAFPGLSIGENRRIGDLWKVRTGPRRPPLGLVRPRGLPGELPMFDLFKWGGAFPGTV